MPIVRLVEALAALPGQRFGALRVAAIGVLLCAPVIWSGLSLDDHLHRAQLTQPSAVQHLGGDEGGPFVLAGRDGPRSVWFGKRSGALPFWSASDLRLAFWKPLSALTHQADYAAFPERPAWMHIHSLVWYLLLLCGATMLYQRMHNKAPIAGLAAMLYALDDGHVMAAGWLAGRNGVIAATFLVMTLYFHDRGRRGSEPLSQVVAWLLAMAGILTSEAYVATLGYLFAYTLTLDRGSTLDRVRSLLPYLAIVLGWHALYVMRGYGATGSGYFLDPGRQPLLFVASLPSRLSLLLGSHYAFGLPELVANLSDDWGKILSLVHVAVVAAVLRLTWPLLQGHRVARFWAIGAALSAVPLCAATASDRQLLMPGIGAMGLLAVLIHYALGPRGRSLWSDLARGGVVALAVVHLLISPLSIPFKAHALSSRFSLPDRCADDLAQHSSLERRHAIALNAPDRCILYAHLLLRLSGGPVPASLQTVSSADSPTTVERVDPYTLRVTPQAGYFSTPAARMFLTSGRVFQVGEQLGGDTPAAQITVVDVDRRGRPTAVDVRFDEPLERGPYTFLQASAEGLRIRGAPITSETLPAVSLGVP